MWDVGTEVKITKGKRAGQAGRIRKVWPGRRLGQPYYFSVRLAGGKVVDAVKKHLEIYTPNEPLGNYWETRDPLGR